VVVVFYYVRSQGLRAKHSLDGGASVGYFRERRGGHDGYIRLEAVVAWIYE
jgi:hypothetical protein